MAHSLQLREQAERCRRLARDCTDPALRGCLLKPPENSARQASAAANDDMAVWQAGPGRPADWLEAIKPREQI
jgi:hypothetical protein